MLLLSCHSNRGRKSQVNSIDNNELLIYCENNMVPPLMELKSSFEKHWGCKVVIHNDCSQNLVGLIQYSLKGDLFIPASNVSFKRLQGVATPNLIDSVFVAYNPLVIILNKNSSNHAQGSLMSIFNTNNSVVLANPETGSLGYETKMLLQRENLYQKAIENVIGLSVDSKGLINRVENAEAEVAISWRSDMYMNKYRTNIESFSIPESDKNPPQIYVGLLSTSTNQMLANKFIDYVSGETGILIFRKYGFSQRKPMIF